jgi:hypothetical protein
MLVITRYGTPIRAAWTRSRIYIYTITVYAFGAGGEIDPLQDIFGAALLGVDVVAELLTGGLFAHPQFHGSLRPRPENKNPCTNVPKTPPGASASQNLNLVHLKGDYRRTS